MTGEEKRKLLKEQLKAQYKKDLQLRKEFLDKAERLKQSQKLNHTISDLVGGLEDDTDDWIEKLNTGSALGEAKLDIMLEQASETSRELDRLAREAQMQKIAAEDLVSQMKREMGIEIPEKPAAEKTENANPAPPSSESSTETPADTNTPEAPRAPKPPKKLGDF